MLAVFFARKFLGEFACMVAVYFHDIQRIQLLLQKKDLVLRSVDVNACDCQPTQRLSDAAMLVSWGEGDFYRQVLVGPPCTWQVAWDGRWEPWEPWSLGSLGLDPNLVEASPQVVLATRLKGFFSEENFVSQCALVLLVAVLRFVLCSFEDKASPLNPNILSGV